MGSPSSSPSSSSPQPIDWGSDDPAGTELRHEADAYAATPQAFPAPPAGTNSSAGAGQESLHAPGETDFVPTDQLPTFELPGGYSQQHVKELAASAAAAAAMNSLHSTDTHMQLDEAQQQRHASTGMQADSNGTVSSSASAAAAGAPEPALLPSINESEAAALHAALQQADDQQLLEAAAAVGGAAPPARQLPGLDAEITAAAGHGSWLDSSATAARLKQLDLQDNQQLHQGQQHHKQQQQQGRTWQQVSQQQQQHQQQQHSIPLGLLHSGQSSQLDLDDLLQYGTTAAGSMDVDTSTQDVDIPVLLQPQQPQQYRASDAVRAQPAAKQGSKRTWPELHADGAETPASDATLVPAEGLGPQDFGLPLQAPPVLPDEPVQLLHTPEPPADSYIV